MIFVTTQARQELCRLLEQKNHEPTDSFRLKSLGQRGMGLAIGERTSDDTTLEVDGKTVLAYDRRLAASRNGISLDAYDTPEGLRFVISKEVVHNSHSSVTVNWITFSQLS